MNDKCEFCHALHFCGERPPDGKFTNCCHKGRVVIPRHKEHEPYLQDILSNPQHPDYKNFKENIRSYNSALSFASMGCNLAEPCGTGPYCFRVHGQIYHNTSNFNPKTNEARKYAQLYVVDSDEANNTRMNNTANTKCNPHIMEKLDLSIRKSNPFADTYKMLGTIEKEQQLDNPQSNPTVNVVFRRNRNSDRR